MRECIALKLYEERPVGVHMVLLYRARGLSFTGELVAGLCLIRDSCGESREAGIDIPCEQAYVLNLRTHESSLTRSDKCAISILTHTLTVPRSVPVELPFLSFHVEKTPTALVDFHPIPRFSDSFFAKRKWLQHFFADRF